MATRTRVNPLNVVLIALSLMMAMLSALLTGYLYLRMSAAQRLLDRQIEFCECCDGYTEARSSTPNN